MSLLVLVMVDLRPEVEGVEVVEMKCWELFSCREWRAKS